ncbi:LPS translocon maturation chaperone LptM [Methylomagnum ishizawai]|uniref:LPS translocon maturation chaperone LptM n=1 Tax=Methylomagnum ishizawai TaxID=1760988 RepID=UPI001C33EA0F|nr:lipoprotein [Methylomagnum ishizawai]BBL75705.1 hypothetical protein MishRS11D_28030 [Methylomagnum ishizawai]
MTPSQSRAALAAALGLSALLAQGCGQKGPLYLERPPPRQPVAAKPKKTTPSPAPATSQKPDQPDTVEQSFPQQEQF